MRKIMTVAALALAATPAAAAEKIDFVLNWIAGGDHAPYYWAKKQGLYEKAGIQLDIEQGKGSAAAVQKVAAGQSQIGLADLGTAMVAKGKGGDMVAVMNIYANSPFGMYWLKSSGIKSVKDFAGKKIGNPPGDAARAMWPALAKANGVDPASVTWVNVAPNAKLTALKAKQIDITTSFYNIHHIFKAELADDMGFLAWKDAGLNQYGNSLLAYGPYLKDKKAVVATFVKVTQQAFGQCVKTPEPCVQALVEANGGLKFDNEMENWKLVAELMSDEVSQSVALGWLDDKRVAADYELVKTYFSIEKPFEVKSIYTNEFLDKSIKMAVVKRSS
jgi:NitT/TauT family transport system substrate-binding protein